MTYSPNEFTRRPLVYVAGPYTTPDPVANTHATIRVAGELLDQGLITPVIPHLTLLWHLVEPRPLDFWYAYDLATLARCDALYRLPGASTGADREVQFAVENDIPAFTKLDELNAWARKRQT